jgi:hypothetical protein
MTDAEARAHGVALAELEQRHNAQLIEIRRRVKLELEKLSLYAANAETMEPATVQRLITRALDRLG